MISFKKKLSLLMIIVLLTSIIQISAIGKEEAKDNTPAFSDMPDNWSTAALIHAVENGLLVGSNGKILPDDYLTRAQMAAIIVRAFGSPDKTDKVEFSDIKGDEWYAADMVKAYQMGIIFGSDGKMYPDRFITRQEVCAILARAFKLSPSKTINKEFKDADMISEWAKEEVYAVVNAGYIQGYNGILDPLGYITRAQFAQVLYNFIKQYIREPGKYTQLSEGNVLVSTPGVLLEDVIINGDLVIGDGVGDGDVTLNNVAVTGRLVVRGGGTNSIIITGNSYVNNIIVARVDGKVRVYTEEGVEVGEVIVDGKDDVVIEGTIRVLTIAAENVKVAAEGGYIKSIAVIGNNSEILVGENSSVEKLMVNAENVSITAEKGSEVKDVIVNNNGANISGDGRVEKVTANASNVKVTTPNTSVTAAIGTTGVLAGDEIVNPGETVTTGSGPELPGGGGSSSGGGAGGGGRDGEKIKVESISVYGDAVVGCVLTAIPSPENAEVNYQWKIADTPDGTYRDITGATENKYTISEEDLGKFIKVTVTGTGKYTGTVSSDAVGPVVYTDAEKTVISNELEENIVVN
ncbi:MAG: hypothetical protein GX187_05015 [Clostridiaceae bacterium]|nr:hypothetical protein [Clostridiaceae bacterium]